MVSLTDCPNELLFLLPFLQRAHEMTESQPVMAYYCKLYSVSLALKGGPNGKFQRSPQTDSFLAKLFDDLEIVKSGLIDHSTIKDMTKGAIYVRELAYRVFLSAEKQESSLSTLKKALQSYLAAVNFLQVYRGVFLEDSSVLDLGLEERADELAQIDEKTKYAKWRIVEIKKDLTLNQSTSPILNKPSLAPAPSPSPASAPINSNPQIPLYPQATSPTSYNPSVVSPTAPPVNYNNVPHTPQPQVYLPHLSSNSSSAGLVYDPKVLSECERHSRHAISALTFDDVESAANSLRTALKLLQPYLKENK